MSATANDYTEQYRQREIVEHYVSIFSVERERINHEIEGNALRDELARLRRRRTYLDVGAGFGRMTRVAAPWFEQVWAVDTSPHMLSRLRKNCPVAEISEMNATALRFQDGCFDCVTCFRLVMNLAPDVRGLALREILRVLVPGGVFLCNIHLNKWSPRGVAVQRRQRRGGPGQPYMSYFGIVAELRAAGFEVVRYRGVRVVPEDRFYPAGREAFAVRLERFLGRVPLLKWFADGYVFVCRKPVAASR